jgi:hypothetical protein
MGRLRAARVGDVGEDIRQVQVMLGWAPGDGMFDHSMEARVRGVQLVHGLHPSGELDDRTLLAIRRMAEKRG